MSVAREYIEHLEKMFTQTMDSQLNNIKDASKLVTRSILDGGRFYLFGTGHSHMIAEELYNRAGGLALVSAILEPSMMLHEHPNKSTYLERLEGYAEVILRNHGVKKEDTIMIISNSGRNIVPVEMAMKSKELGTNVIALTSMNHSTKVTSRHPDRKSVV